MMGILFQETDAAPLANYKIIFYVRIYPTKNQSVVKLQLKLNFTKTEFRRVVWRTLLLFISMCFLTGQN